MAGPERRRLADSGKGYVRPPADPEATAARRVGQGAKGRCNNRRNPAYPNYGGRGIKFQFKTGADFAKYILKELGPRPSTAHSIDRIDNDQHYAPGNLRWATRAEQANNKRQYKCSEVGQRIRDLQNAGSPFAYETIRGFICNGLTDAEILSRKKTTSGRPRKC
jgi:hypothetical protein